tara:strand:+ start:7987 stop:8358 length:372 start_codon:yes stop_codon:yes gene_type:complete
MDYSKFVKILSNNYRNIYVYKYIDIIKDSDKILFEKCYNNWVRVSDEDISVLKDSIAKYTDNNINIRGNICCNTIELYNDDSSIHYYIVFKNNKVNDIYYIEGVYETTIFNDNFEFLLMMLSY